MGLVIVGATFAVLNRGSSAALGGHELMRTAAGALAFGLLGGLIADRRPRNVVGWLCLSIGVLNGVVLAAAGYGVYGAVVAPDSLPWAELAVWLSLWVWVPAYTSIATVLLLLVPIGRLPSPRWRPVLAVGVLGVVTASVGWALLPYDRRDSRLVPEIAELGNPAGVDGAVVAVNASLPVLVGVAIAAVAGLAVRLRRATEVERQQTKLVVLGAAATIVLIARGMIFTSTGGYFAALAMVALPAALTTAMLRHRLFDIDQVLRRSLLYGALTAAVAAMYASVIFVLGDRLGERAGAPLVAAVVVAIGVQPVRDRLQGSVNRLVYGDRNDPYAALSRIGQRLEAAATPDQALDGVAQTVSRALRVPYVELRVPELDPVVAGHPVADTLDVALVHQGATVGSLHVAHRGPGESFSPADRRLIDDLARQAAVAVHASVLHHHLLRSRERIVLAREEERRRLRHDLHDGVGPTLAAITLQLEGLRDVLGDEKAARPMIDRLTEHLRCSIADVRRLVDDLRPPALDDLGLVGALAQQVDRFDGASLQVDLVVRGDVRTVPAATDLAAYRIACEALTNVVKHAQATRCTVSVSYGADALEVSVADDGVGVPADWSAGVGLVSMHERASELAGTCDIDIRPDGGTEVRAVLPAVNP